MAYLDYPGLTHYDEKLKQWIEGPDSDIAHKTGDETLEGVKTFQNTGSGNVPGDTVTDLVIRNPQVTRGTPVEGGRSFTRVVLADAEGDTEATFAGRLGLLEVQSPKENDTLGEELNLRCYKYSGESADYSKTASLAVGYDINEIPYATAPVTSDDRTDSTDIVTRGFMEASEWNWQKTKKAGAVTFKPVPESDLEPVVDFMFTETPPASGDKGPENPSTISGVSNVKLTRCGKNLCPIDNIFTENITGLTVSTNTADGYVSISGTASSNGSVYIRTETGNNNFLAYSAVQRGKTYKFSLVGDAPAGVALKLFIKEVGESSYATRVNITSGNSVAYTIPTYADRAMLRLDIASGTQLNCKCYIQVEEGDFTTVFEPYLDNDYTIQLGDTYYGGSLDVATGVMTVTHVAVAPAGATVDISSAPAALPLEYADTYGREITSADGTSLSVGSSGGTVVYKLATPQTVQLTPTQVYSLPALDKYEPRINTVYTDQEAVQVGYRRYANYVDLTTDQAIDGIKSFTKDVYALSRNYYSRQNWITKGTNPSGEMSACFGVVDKDKKNIAQIRGVVSAAGDASTHLTVWDFGNTTAGAGSACTAGLRCPKNSTDYNFYPYPSNSIKLGTADRLWSVVYAGTGSINTSDERLKQNIGSIPDEVLDAWQNVGFCQFKLTEAVEKKGESARLHSGLIAQRIAEAFSAKGLDASRYGLFCFDAWAAEPESRDNDGTLIQQASPAGDRYSLRYEEALCMEAACQRRRADRAEARIKALEDRLAALEAKLA